MNVKHAIQEFLLSCQADNLARSTTQWYAWCLREFTESDQPVSRVTAHELRAYIVKLKTRDYTEHTISDHIRALHRFWAWASQEYAIANPMRNIAYPKQPAPTPRAAALEDVQRMFTAADNSRDRAILAFLLDTGCRAGGLCTLRPSDLDIPAGRAIVTEKGSKTRAVRFIRETGELLSLWSAERLSAPYYFYNIYTLDPLKPNGLYQLLRRLARRAGVTGRFNPHSLRHLFAKEYIKEGGDLATLSQILGHRDVSTTVSHYTIFTNDDLRDAHERFSPARKLEDGNE